MYKASNILSTEALADTCAEIQSFLEAPYNADVAQDVTDRAAKLEAYMALSGKMLADAKYHYNDVLNSHFIEAVKVGHQASMAPMVLGKYINSLCKDFQYLVDWTGRINAAATHQLDFSRTLISKLKEEMRQLQYGQQSSNTNYQPTILATHQDGLTIVEGVK